jgi:hypothetical protein
MFKFLALSSCIREYSNKANEIEQINQIAESNIPIRDHPPSFIFVSVPLGITMSSVLREISKYPPPEVGALRLLAPQRGLIAIEKAKSKP